MSSPLHLRFPPGCHPLDQVHYWCNEIPCEAQLDVLRAWAKYRKVLATFCNSGGKTSIVLRCAILSAMTAFRGAKCLVMGGAEGQLFGQLYADIKKVIQRLPSRDSWDIKDGDKIITAPNGSYCKFYVPATALKVEGFHGEWSGPPSDPNRYFMPVFYFTDESKGIPNDRMEDGVGRIEPDFLMSLTSPGYDREHWTYRDMNPVELDEVVRERTKKYGENPPRDPYEPDPRFVFENGLWRYRRMIKPVDLPHLLTPERMAYREGLAQKHGKNSQFYRSMVMGEFALDGSENNIFMPRHLESVMRAMAGEFKPVPGDIRAAADVSGGGDGQVLGVRDGTDVLLLKQLDSMNEPATARYLVETLRHLDIQPHQFTIDGIGTGASIGHIMEDTLGFVGINYFMSNNNPMQNFEYADRYTELHYWLRELLEYGCIRLPNNKMLYEQMQDRLWAPRSDTGRYAGKVGCEPKTKYREKHAGRSPDQLDTLVYLFSDFNMDSVRRGYVSETARKAATVDKASQMEREADGAQVGGGGAFSNLRPMPRMSTLRQHLTTA